MDEYRRPYLVLWSACSDALEALSLENYDRAKELLTQAQRQAVRAFLTGEGDTPPKS
jgi:hypothetical protein